jgi:hypothetical protein
LIDFLDAGKGVYIDGANFSSYNEGTMLYDRFGTKLSGVGDVWQNGNIETVFGEASTLVEGLDYNYSYQQPPDNLLDDIESNGGLLVFTSQDGLGRGIMYGGVSNTYQTINTSFIFSALVNGINTKHDLMAAYMNYLTGNTVVEEFTEDLISEQSLSIAPNPFSKLTNVSFSTEQTAQGIELNIFDITGRLVKSFGSLPAALGSTQISWDGTDNTGRRVSSGTYIIRITTERDAVNRTVVLID